MIYPQKISSKKSEQIINICLVFSIIVAMVLIIINKLTTPEIQWSGLANCGIIYIWFTVIYSIKKGTNIAGHVLIQIILSSIAMLYIDKTTGAYGWSIYIGIPIAIIVANVTMVILTIIGSEKYVKYAIYQLIIVLISLMPITLIAKNIIEMKILIKVAIDISVFSLISSLILCYRDIKEAIIRKIHM